MTRIADKVADFLRNTATKIEELQLQTALGKAELIDSFEELKKDTQDNLNHYKAEVHTFIDDKGEDIEKLKDKLEQLELELSVKKAEALDEFDDQKIRLTNAVQEIKKALANY